MLRSGQSDSKCKGAEMGQIKDVFREQINNKILRKHLENGI